MNPKTRKIFLISSSIFAFFYVIFLFPAKNGYGYAGYSGYHRGPSFLYWGGGSARYYPRNRSVRSGSRGGSSYIRGGGPGSGK